MRYLILTYVTKPDGRVDEQMQVSRSMRPRDIQTANVILDFKKLRVEKCSMNGTIVPKDWDRIVQYYYQHYQNVIDRLFAENGWQVDREDQPASDSESSVLPPVDKVAESSQ